MNKYIVRAIAPVFSLLTLGCAHSGSEVLNEGKQLLIERHDTPGYGAGLLKEYHYTQAIRVGDAVEISGQGGWNDSMEIPKSLSAEIDQAFLNVEATLKAAGASWQDVVSIDSYHVGLSPPVLELMTRNFRKHLPGNPPLWTAVGVPALGIPAMRVEVRAKAIVLRKTER